jgi:hypothetical protein
LLLRQCSVCVTSKRPRSKYRLAACAPPQNPKYGQLSRHASTPDRYSAIHPDGALAAAATMSASEVRNTEPEEKSP